MKSSANLCFVSSMSLNTSKFLLAMSKPTFSWISIINELFRDTYIYIYIYEVNQDLPAFTHLLPISTHFSFKELIFSRIHVICKCIYMQERRIIFKWKRKKGSFYSDRSDQFKFQVIFKIKPPNKVILLLLLLFALLCISVFVHGKKSVS